MANKNFRIKQGLNLEPTTVAVAVAGDVAYASGSSSLTYYNTAVRQVASLDETQTFTNKTISAGGTNLIGATAITGTTGTGNVVFAAGATFSGTTTFPGSSNISSNGSATFSTATLEPLIVTTSGDSRAARFTASSTATGVASTALLRIGNSNNTTNNYEALVAYNSANAFVASIEFQNKNHNSAGTQTGEIAFTTANAGSVAERLRIDSSGDMGLGTTSPNIRGFDRALTINASAITNGVALELANNGVSYGELFADTTNNAVTLNAFANVPLVFRTNNTEKARITTAGHLGLGTTTPNKTGFIGPVLTINSTSSNAAAVEIGVTATDQALTAGNLSWYTTANTGGSDFRIAEIRVATDGATANRRGGVMSFRTAVDNGLLTERATIDNAGSLQVGVAAPPDTSHLIRNSSTTSVTLGVRNTSISTSSDAIPNLDFIKGSTTSTNSQVFAQFWSNARTQTEGLLVAGAAGSHLPALITSSDLRLKKNITSLSSLSKITELNPVHWEWKDDSGYSDGFIAQELIHVFPDLVTSSDDGSGESLPEGTEPWRVGYAALVPHLVSAIKELKAQNDTLLARILALENN